MSQTICFVQILNLGLNFGKLGLGTSLRHESFVTFQTLCLPNVYYFVYTWWSHDHVSQGEAEKVEIFNDQFPVILS